MKRKSYEKLINNARREIRDIQKEINFLPEINLFNSMWLWFQYFVRPTSTQELYERLSKVKSKVKTVMDTYARGDNSTIGTTIEKEANSTSDNYFTQLMSILEEIKVLEKKLERKDFQNFLNNLSSKNQFNKGDM